MIVTGHTLEKGGKVSIHRVLAEVVAVGKYDAFVVLSNSSSFNKHPFRIPLACCQKVDGPKADIITKVHEPKVGDLVLSIDPTYTGTKKHVGIVKKIICMPGDAKRAVLEHSTKAIVVPYKSLIILEN